MHALLAALASWPGRQATKSVLQAKGYWLPERFKEIVLANCGGCDAPTLERYWDETAREYICAAGRVRSNRRDFYAETSYRSSYLDDLASLPANRDAASRGLQLDHGLQVFHNKTVGTDLWRRIGACLETKKFQEIDTFAISGEEWTDTKGDFANYLQKIAEQRGFVRKNKKWQKSYGGIFDFHWSINPGMRRTWRFQLPIMLEIFHRSAPDLVFYAPRADQILPGFHFYTLHKSPESAILGIQAHVDLFDIIGRLMIAARTSAMS